MNGTSLIPVAGAQVRAAEHVTAWSSEPLYLSVADWNLLFPAEPTS